jgi:uncharacterized membrane protein
VERPRWRVWLADLRSGMKVVYALLALVLFVAASVSAVAGAHVATPWLVAAALVVLLVVACLMYANAAAERDAARASAGAGDMVTRAEMTAEIERQRVHIKSMGDGTVMIGTAAQFREKGLDVPSD